MSKILITVLCAAVTAVLFISCGGDWVTVPRMAMACKEGKVVNLYTGEVADEAVVFASSTPFCGGGGRIPRKARCSSDDKKLEVLCR